MTLALAIPVRDDESRLRRLLDQAAGLGIFDQVVIVDDGSRTPLILDIVPDPLRARAALCRNDAPVGAGRARNQALGEIRTDCVLFFDSDDLLTEELAALWKHLRGKTFDLCLFRHADSRVIRAGGWGQMQFDDRLWRDAGMGGQALSDVTGQRALILSETANYPWNKVYRTGFLRDHGIGCSDVPVHEDVAFHWLSFLEAETVLASDRVAAVHHVSEASDRLTNLKGAERLLAFAPFAQIAQRIRQRQGAESALLHRYLRFISGLSVWIRRNLERSLHDALDDAQRQYLRAVLKRDVARHLAERDPGLLIRLIYQAAGTDPGAHEVLRPMIHRRPVGLTPPLPSGLAPVRHGAIPPDPDTLMTLCDKVVSS